MRTATLALCALLLLPAIAVGDLMKIIAICEVYTQDTYVAFEDNEVWFYGAGPFHRLEHIDRDVPIVEMQGYNGSSVILIRYEDDEVWMAGRSTFEFYWDAHRDGAEIVDMSTEYRVLFAYNDGQAWSTDGQTWHHEVDFEREAPVSTVPPALLGEISPAISPNPSSGACRVSFRLDVEGPVAVQVIDVSGRVVRELLDGVLPIGEYRLDWSGQDDEGYELPAGVYLTRITTAAGTTTGRAVLVR